MYLAEGIYNIKIEWGTFIGQLAGFALIVWAIVKYVVPPVRAMMSKQQDAVRTQLSESEQATARLAEAKRSYEQAVTDAHVESAKIREDARTDAQRITEQLRQQADAEVARIKQQGADQIELTRQQLVRELQADLGAAALTEAESRVREHLDSTQAKSDSVDRFLDELEAMAGSTGGKREF